jgi:hypothetical protein
MLIMQPWSLQEVQLLWLLQLVMLVLRSGLVAVLSHCLGGGFGHQTLAWLF